MGALFAPSAKRTNEENIRAQAHEKQRENKSRNRSREVRKNASNIVDFGYKNGPKITPKSFPEGHRDTKRRQEPPKRGQKRPRAAEDRPKSAKKRVEAKNQRTPHLPGGGWVGAIGGGRKAYPGGFRPGKS